VIISLVVGAIVLDHFGGYFGYFGGYRFSDIHILRTISIILDGAMAAMGLAGYIMMAFVFCLPVFWALGRLKEWLEGIGERRAEERRNKAFEVLRAAAKKEEPQNEERDER
jgi:hypothetical protein